MVKPKFPNIIVLLFKFNSALTFFVLTSLAWLPWTNFISWPWLALYTEKALWTAAGIILALFRARYIAVITVGPILHKKKIEWIIHSIYGVNKFHSLRSEIHSILTPVGWKFTTQRVESRSVHSIFTPKEVITEVAPKGVTSVTNRVKTHSMIFREEDVHCKKALSQ